MRDRFKNILAWALIPQIILVKWLGSYPQWVEKNYSLGLYRLISENLRRLYGWLPVSIGDLAYIGLGLVLVYLLWKKRYRFTSKPIELFRDFMALISVAYFSFHLLWGFNYYRVPLEETLDINPHFSKVELLALTDDLIKRTNYLQKEISGDTIRAVSSLYKREDIFKMTLDAYTVQGREKSQFRYRYPALKSSLISLVLTYMGYSGYLNPFTNEAQVNKRIPPFRLPVVSAHEIAHQLGYSAENEANFIGYLTVSNYKDPFFKYAASAYALGYCLNELNRRDEVLYEEKMADINAGVMANYKELRDFWEFYSNPAEPIFKEVFSTFLKVNNQKDGIASYSRVVALLIGYHSKYPLPTGNSENVVMP